jgi:hypothetical protein
MAITATETSLTDASSTDSVWDDIEVRPLTEDDWISFDFGSVDGNATSVTPKKVDEPAKETIQRGVLEVKTENEAMPFDEEADTAASRMTPSPWMRKTFVEPIAEARMALQKSISARQKTRAVGVSSTVSQPIESHAAPPKRVTCSRIVSVLDHDDTKERSMNILLMFLLVLPVHRLCSLTNSRVVARNSLMLVWQLQSKVVSFLSLLESSSLTRCRELAAARHTSRTPSLLRNAGVRVAARETDPLHL